MSFQIRETISTQIFDIPDLPQTMLFTDNTAMNNISVNENYLSFTNKANNQQLIRIDNSHQIDAPFKVFQLEKCQKLTNMTLNPIDSNIIAGLDHTRLLKVFKIKVDLIEKRLSLEELKTLIEEKIIFYKWNPNDADNFLTVSNDILIYEKR